MFVTFIKAEAFAWEGTLSQEAITILAQHAVQGKLTGADTAMARWLVFAYTHHDLPLNYQVFLPTIDKLHYALLNNMFHEEEVSKILFLGKNLQLIFNKLPTPSKHLYDLKIPFWWINTPHS